MEREYITYNYIIATYDQFILDM